MEKWDFRTMTGLCTRGKFKNGYRGRKDWWEWAGEKNLCRSMHHPGKQKTGYFYV